MADKSKIEWTDSTWNPITGCSPVSPACGNCYASRQIRSGRTPAVHGSKDFEKVTFHPSRLGIPLHWKKPRRIFVCSMGDLFHEDVRHEWIAQVFEVTRQAPRHTYMFLTKRPVAMKHHYLQWLNNSLCADVPSNIWLGVTVENQEMADDRIPVLLDTHAEKRFISIEPMLGPVDLRRYLPVIAGHDRYHWEGGDLDWIILGPENGPGKRPMNLDWARRVRDDCQAAGVPFFYKGGPLDGIEHHHFPEGREGR